MRYADLPPGFVIAHRGGALQVPENTLEGYRAALAQGQAVLEQDVQVLADGELGVMHDGTVDRTTTSRGNVADHTAASWARLRIDAGTTLGGGWRDDLRPPLFREVLAELGGRVLLCPEAKSAGTMGPLLDELERAGASREAVLVQSFSRRDCREAVARGWPALWLGTTDPAAAAADGVAWIGVAASRVTPALCRAARAAGVRVACYTVNRRWLWDRLRSWGVDACFSDDPAHLQAPARRCTRDAFAEQRWAPGMQADDGVRGRFHPDGSFGFDADGPGASSALVGHLGPSDPSDVRLDLSVRVDAGGDGGDGAASLLLATTDQPLGAGAAPGVDGYLFLLHGSGRLVLRRVRGGVATTLAEAGAAPPVAGEYVRVSVAASAAGVTWGRADGAGEVAAPGTTGCGLDVLSLGRRGAAVRFKDVVFS